ncbi:MAG: addiction module toxin, HicA family [Candidatus Viridilinea halotolerans]|uniref:Addiction module toxin, HicA family n=1 Tax=Candidatus Viridilinea halotolerans TaxID=2491704 RepID=A0A426TQY0_9CHLR|nr:MAG: addiction module toxin, HicA family [Candidatus Viridilinea halotolerans]
MKRTDLVRHLPAHGCELYREGSKHSLYRNLATNRVAAVPRHTEIKDLAARRICDDLGVPRP